MLSSPAQKSFHDFLNPSMHGSLCCSYRIFHSQYSTRFFFFLLDFLKWRFLLFSLSFKNRGRDFLSGVIKDSAPNAGAWVPSLVRELGPALGNEDSCATIKTQCSNTHTHTHTQNQLFIFYLCFWSSFFSIFMTGNSNNSESVFFFFQSKCNWLGDKKNPPANVGALGSVSESGRSPGEGNGSPPQYTCLENSMNREA